MTPAEAQALGLPASYYRLIPYRRCVRAGARLMIFWHRAQGQEELSGLQDLFNLEWEALAKEVHRGWILLGERYYGQN